MLDPIRPAPTLIANEPIGPFSIIVREYSQPPRQIGPFETLKEALSYARSESAGPGGQVYINDGSGKRLPVDPKR